MAVCDMPLPDRRARGRVLPAAAHPRSWHRGASVRIAIVTDAWRPQVNGVVTTLEQVGAALVAAGHEVIWVSPRDARTVGLPGYPEIRLAVGAGGAVQSKLDAAAPDAIHIATEGPLGWAARRYCLRRGLPFTTAYHTQFPHYVRMRAPVPIDWTYRALRAFHRPAAATLVATPSLRDALSARGFQHLALWSRGVDTALFRPRERSFLDLPRPISLTVGRVAVEKNIEAFLELDLPGTRVVVGDGPDRRALQRRYPDVVFTGYQQGVALASHIAAADVFVFPSRTDTFGLTMLEALACGVPVAAYPVTGPLDIIRDGVTGALDEDLGRAVARAMRLEPAACVHDARARSWAACAEALLANLVPCRSARAA